MNILTKFRETLNSVVPIMLIVLFLNFTIAPLGNELIFRFIVGGILLIVGLTVFLLGVDIGIQPTGERIGASLISKKNMFLLLFVAFIIGFMVTIAEPDVQVLADQIKNVSPGVGKYSLIIAIAAGVGFFVAIGLLRSVLSIPLNLMLILFYFGVFALAFFSPSKFQGVAFDAGGATTGPMTVPFIMSLGLGVSAVRSSGKKSEEADGFGLTGLASIGPVAAVLLYGIIITSLKSNRVIPETIEVNFSDSVSDRSGFMAFIQLVPEVFHEVLSALSPLVFLFALFQIFLLKMPPMQLHRMIKGLIYSFIGLLIFLTGVKGGFMPAGEKLGLLLGELAVSSVFYKYFLIVLGFIFGAVVVCAEPAVWVLTEQVETVSGGNVKRKIMLAALSLGVAISIAISILRIVLAFSLWYIIIPGYLLALVMTLFCPKLFTGIAFDSGGVASGPMTSTFILSFMLGISSSFGGDNNSAFGVIALVALTPLIAIQILGIIYGNKKNKIVKNK